MATETKTKSNKYFLADFREGSTPQSISFYEMGVGNARNKGGTTLEEMLRVSIERLEDLNGRFPCDENDNAIAQMKNALMFLNKRTKDREARGVEGKHEA